MGTTSIVSYMIPEVHSGYIKKSASLTIYQEPIVLHIG